MVSKFFNGVLVSNLDFWCPKFYVLKLWKIFCPARKILTFFCSLRHFSVLVSFWCNFGCLWCPTLQNVWQNPLLPFCRIYYSGGHVFFEARREGKERGEMEKIFFPLLSHLFSLLAAPFRRRLSFPRSRRRRRDGRRGGGGERQKDKAAYITSPLSPSSHRGRKKKNLFYGPTTEEGRGRGRGERQKAIDRLWGAV